MQLTRFLVMNQKRPDRTRWFGFAQTYFEWKHKKRELITLLLLQVFLQELLCITSLFAKSYEGKDGGGGIPGLALEPKFASQISIGALPLWRHSLSLVPVTPTTW